MRLLIHVSWSMMPSSRSAYCLRLVKCIHTPIYRIFWCQISEEHTVDTKWDPDTAHILTVDGTNWPYFAPLYSLTQLYSSFSNMAVHVVFLPTLHRHTDFILLFRRKSFRNFVSLSRRTTNCIILNFMKYDFFHFFYFAQGPRNAYIIEKLSNPTTCFDTLAYPQGARS
jgi:hypothetical protein